MKKYIADTNFILRYLLADNKENYKRTQIIFEQARIGKCQIEIEQSIFTEVIFVLSSFYEVPRIEIVRILKSLLSYKGIKVDSNFTYSSDNNKDWMKISELQNWIKKNQSKIGKI